jgi:hypothetical protein
MTSFFSFSFRDTTEKFIKYHRANQKPQVDEGHKKKDNCFQSTRNGSIFQQGGQKFKNQREGLGLRKPSKLGSMYITLSFFGN